MVLAGGARCQFDERALEHSCPYLFGNTPNLACCSHHHNSETAYNRRKVPSNSELGEPIKDTSVHSFNLASLSKRPRKDEAAKSVEP